MFDGEFFFGDDVVHEEYGVGIIMYYVSVLDENPLYVVSFGDRIVECYEEELVRKV